jgi:hypothetical protein
MLLRKTRYSFRYNGMGTDMLVKKPLKLGICFSLLCGSAENIQKIKAGVNVVKYGRKIAARG